MKNRDISLFNLMGLGLFALSILLTVESTFASTKEKNCTAVDIRKEVGPIRDQGDIGWCYANAAADLLSFEYKDQLGGQQASAIYMALSFTETFIGKSFFEGGSDYLSLKAYAAKHKSVCLQSAEEKLMTQGLKTINGKPITLKGKLNQLMDLKARFDTFSVDTKNKKSLDWFLAKWQELKKQNSFLFSMGDRRLIGLLAHSSTEDFPHDVADALCENHSTPVHQVSEPEGLFTVQNDFLKSQAVRLINNQLDVKNIASLTYRASVLVSPTVETDIMSAHVSVLVGRKWNKESNQCEYLIRNSWGKGCYAYRNSPIFKPRCEGDGHVWIPEDIMKKSMIGISYFEHNSFLKKVTNNYGRGYKKPKNL